MSVTLLGATVALPSVAAAAILGAVLGMIRSRQADLRLRRRLQELRDESMPVAIVPSHTLAEVRDDYSDLDPGTSTGDVVTVIGEVVSERVSASEWFATLRDEDDNRLQVMLSPAGLGGTALEDWKANVEPGDVVVVRGEVVGLRRGPLSVCADGWQLASKAKMAASARTSDDSDRGAVSRDQASRRRPWRSAGDSGPPFGKPFVYTDAAHMTTPAARRRLRRWRRPRGAGGISAASARDGLQDVRLRVPRPGRTAPAPDRGDPMKRRSPMKTRLRNKLLSKDSRIRLALRDPAVLAELRKDPRMSRHFTSAGRLNRAVPPLSRWTRLVQAVLG